MTTQLQYGLGGDRPYDLYYQHSGRTPVASVLVAGIVGIAAAIVAGIIYAYIVDLVPYIKLRFIATMGFGAAVGFVTARIAKAGKVRSIPIGLAIVGFATFVGYYVCWIVWIKLVLSEALSNRPNFQLTYSQLILSPPYLWDWITRINRFGIWLMSKGDKEPVKGAFLTCLWFVEAASIFGCSLAVAFYALREEMFCEACNRWCGKGTPIRRVEIGDPIRVRQTLEAHDFSYLDTLPPTAGDRYWMITHDYCPGCNRLHALSVKQNIITRNKKGAVAGQKKKTVVNRLLLEEAEAQSIRQGRSATPPA
jgi:hypothetical protein